MKTFWIIIIGLFLSLSFVSPAKATEGYYKKQSGFNYNYTEAYDLKNTNGNDRLYKKKLADIERASSPAMHYDSQIRSHYMCDWQYNKVLGRWVCGKDYMKAYSFTHPEPIQACPFGYELNYGRTGCVRVRTPQNAHLNSRGNGWECSPGFHSNYAGTECISDKYVYTSCPGTTCTGCATICNKPSCRDPFPNRPIYEPQTIVAVERPVKYINVTEYDTPTNLAKTGPGTFWILVFSLLGFVILRMSRTFIK